METFIVYLFKYHKLAIFFIKKKIIKLLTLLMKIVVVNVYENRDNNKFWMLFLKMCTYISYIPKYLNKNIYIYKILIIENFRRIFIL